MAKSKHTVEIVKTPLELEENLNLQETGWKLQRIGYVMIFLFVIAAGIGLFGDGLLSKKTLTAGNSTIIYDKFHRREAIMEVKIDINSPGVTSATVAFPNEYMESFRIGSITPEPNQTIFSGDLQSYIFNGSDHMKIIFELVPKRTGRSGGTLKVNRDVFVLNHFIYP